MAKISLGDLQKAADEKYGPFVIEDVPGGDVVLLNSLRLPKEKKVELERLQTGAVELAKRLAAGELSDDELKEATVNPGFSRILRLSCESDEAADRLFDVIGDDFGLLVNIWNAYTEAVNPGEAPPSQS
jgi:hypothetical protein